jgi:hypothetical protein
MPGTSRQDLQHPHTRIRCCHHRRRQSLHSNLPVSWISIALLVVLLLCNTDSSTFNNGSTLVVNAAVISTSGILTAFGPARSSIIYSAQIVYFNEDENSMRLPVFHRLGTNLMLPPGVDGTTTTTANIDSYRQLCEYPTDSVEEYLSSIQQQQQQNEIFLSDDIRESNNTNNANSTSEEEEDLLPMTFEYSPLTLLVSLGGCDVLQKVQVALQIQQNITGDLWSIIFYNEGNKTNTGNGTATSIVLESDDDNTISPLDLPKDINSTIIPGIDGLILATVSYASGIQILDQMDRIVSYISVSGIVTSPIMLTGIGNDQWRFPTSLEPGIAPQNGGSSSSASSTTNQFGAVFFSWVRLILISLFILLPIIRGITLWYRAGGRISFRRDENTGRIVGLMYVRASPLFYQNDAGGVRIGPSSRSGVHGKLTEEEVMELLPEISYASPPVDHDIVIEGEDYVAGARQSSTAEPTSTTTTGTTAATTSSSLIQIGMGSDDDDETPTRQETNQGDGTASSTVISCNSEQRMTIGGNNNDCEDGQTDINQNTVEASGGGSISAVRVADSAGGHRSSVVLPTTTVMTKPLFTSTISTTCSICIEEFEEGEKIRLLPKCGHAYHTECIIPWLTERQGCCPFCKADVKDTTMTTSGSHIRHDNGT